MLWTRQNINDDKTIYEGDVEDHAAQAQEFGDMSSGWLQDRGEKGVENEGGECATYGSDAIGVGVRECVEAGTADGEEF